MIAEYIAQDEKISVNETRRLVWMVDSKGLITRSRAEKEPDLAVPQVSLRAPGRPGRVLDRPGGGRGGEADRVDRRAQAQTLAAGRRATTRGTRVTNEMFAGRGPRRRDSRRAPRLFTQAVLRAMTRGRRRRAGRVGVACQDAEDRGGAAGAVRGAGRAACGSPRECPNARLRGSTHGKKSFGGCSVRRAVFPGLRDGRAGGRARRVRSWPMCYRSPRSAARWSRGGRCGGGVPTADRDVVEGWVPPLAAPRREVRSQMGGAAGGRRRHRCQEAVPDAKSILMLQPTAYR